MSNDLGIDTWICSWWGPESWEDTTLRSAVLPVLLPEAGHDPELTFCILYETGGILGLDPERGIEFDEASTATFVEHFRFLASRYFSHPAYRRIGGKPVVYLYLSRTFSGEYAAALAKARAAAAELGFSLFLVGDEVYWGEPDKERISRLDAVTSYNMHGPKKYAELEDYRGFVEDCGEVYRRYRDVAEELGVTFIPGVMPGFDATHTANGANYYVIPRTLSPGSSETLLGAMEAMAKPLVDPVLRTVALTTFNEWHEGTQVEPSARK